MNQLKQALFRIMHPGRWIVLCGVVITCALMTLILGLGLFQDTLFAYAAYLVSAYSLVIFCISARQWITGVLLPALDRQPLLHRYRTDALFKAHTALRCSLLLNFLYAAIKLISGMCYGSFWLMTLGVYYLCLLCMRCLLAHYVRQHQVGQDLLAEYRRYRSCGIIMALMNLALSGVVVLVLIQNKTFHYAGVLIYVMAMYAFYAVISACISLVRYRKQVTPILSAATVIRLAAALVSMLALETAMITQFDTTGNPLYRRTMVALTGAAVCAAILGMAIFMIVRATRQIRQLREAEPSPVD